MVLAGFIAIYLFFCLMVAYFGSEVTIGFGGVFVVSIFITPILAALFIVLFRPQFKHKTLEDWANED